MGCNFDGWAGFESQVLLIGVSNILMVIINLNSVAFKGSRSLAILVSQDRFSHPIR